MELVKRKIHMDRIGAEAVNQICLEDDINLPEEKPDVNRIRLEKSSVVIEEIRPGAADGVFIRGRLVFSILYHTLEEGGRLVFLEGKVPFEETLYMQGIVSTDTVRVSGDTEDLTVSLINSRKLNLQAVVTLLAQKEEWYDEEIPIGLKEGEETEYRMVPVQLTQLVVRKNDIFRIKEEISLPSGYPNIFQILWYTMSMGDVTFQVQNGKLLLNGDAHLFFLYEGEGEDHPVRSFETTVPFDGSLECHGCKEGMIPDIRYTVGQEEFTLRPDFDGEERNIGLEIALEIDLRIYEEEQVHVVSDLYGVTKDIRTERKQGELRKLLARTTGKVKLTEHVREKNGEAKVLQLLHCEGKVLPAHQEVVSNGIVLQGCLLVTLLYITEDDASPYVSKQIQLPYQYTLDVLGILPEDMSQVHGKVEQLQAVMSDGEEIDVKAILSFATTVFQKIPMEIIQKVTVEEPDWDSLAKLPGMAIYVVKQSDNLWTIGKKYYVPVQVIRSLNELTSDDLQPGQKLFIVKGG